MPITNETKLTVTRLALKVWTTSISGQGWKTGSLRAQTAKPGPPCRSRPRIRSRRERGDSEGSRRRTSSADEEAEKRNEIVVDFPPHMVRQGSFFFLLENLLLTQFLAKDLFSILINHLMPRRKKWLWILHITFTPTPTAGIEPGLPALQVTVLCIASLPDIICRCLWLLVVLWVASNTLQLSLQCQ